MLKLSTLKAGDQVGFATNTTSYYSTGLRNPGLAIVTKVNGHGHITLDNGKVYDKHGNERGAYSHSYLLEVSAVQADQARRDFGASVDSQVKALNAAISGCTTRTGKMIPNTAALDQMQAAITALRAFV